MMCLVDLMNHIYEDEQDIAFEEYLTEENLNLLKQRRASTSGYDSKEVQNSLMVFSPSYKIRPTAQQVCVEQIIGHFIFNLKRMFCCLTLFLTNFLI